jgi:hypothetical protein
LFWRPTLARNRDSQSPAAPYRYTDQTGDVPPRVFAEGTLDVVAENGSFQIDSDSSPNFVWTLPPEPSPMTIRGFLASGGKEILALQTNPGSMVAAYLRSDD